MTDHGAQPQRTGLAWQRTALAAAGCTLLLLHSASQRHWGVAALPAVFGGLTAATLAAAGARRERALRRGAECTTMNPRTAVFVSFLVAVTAISVLTLR
ncbi:DUF202 domain-containing protein [Amycolatopsis sp. H20-H5]|uniref:DUF202 domain-containing protein n=1 Tax=Amycolatopsis sp. H20-H5 TaxID=3046309 RepID=UPI002DBA3FFB|nr:DUF202 domain-containing protein [Amycolatopsis sp. H20-H5]MEC3973667.1 DUF202 domain-containing protein [Amycolatopsis sp. H20-H5]